MPTTLEWCSYFRPHSEEALLLSEQLANCGHQTLRFRPEHRMLLFSPTLDVRFVLGIAIILVANSLYAAGGEFSPWQSRTRVVVPLGGQWQRSLDDGRSWQPVSLPRVEDAAPNRILYRKTIHLDSTALERTWHLSFGGVRDAVEVTINGQYLGRFFSGQVPFSVTIPRGVLHAGRNTVELSASFASDEAALQQRMQWRAPLRPVGIVRPVALIGSASAATIERIALDQELDQEKALLRITASIGSQRGNAAPNLLLRATLRQGGTIVASSEQPVAPIPERTLPVTMELRVPSPQLWSVQSPSLYQLQIEVSAAGVLLDDLERSIAFRSVQPARGEHALIRINGAPVLARGVVYVDQWQSRPDGRLVEPNYERDVRLLQQLGVNLVYCAWLPPSQRFLELCSSAGIAVVLDLPFGDLPTRYYAQEELRTRAQNMMVRLRDAYGGEPCVVGYVLSSMAPLSNDAVQEFIGTLALLVPPGTLRFAVLAAGHPLDGGGGKTLPLDAVFISDQTLWRSRSAIEPELSRTLATLGQKPWAILGGALVQPFNRNGYADPLSVEAQAAAISQLYRLGAAYHTGGTIVRCFCDYQTLFPLLPTNTPSEQLCYEGLVDTARRTRLAFEMLRALNTGEPEPLLQAGSYDAGTPYVFMAGGMGGLVLLFWLMNRSRRFREYMLRAFLHSHNFFMDIRDQRILLQGQTLLLALLLATTYALVLATLLYVTRQSPAADYLSNLLTLGPSGKALYIQLAWSPELAMTVIVLVVLVKIIGVALVVRLIAAVAKRAVFFADALTMVVWALVPVVLFLPFAMVLFRLLAITPPLLWLGLLAMTTLWSILRLLRACSIVFEEVPWLVYVAGLGSIAIIAGIVVIALQSTFAWGSYLVHFLQLFFP
ncbi:Beta-galactosidase [bacterium HR20]|nr:Beta-galactosidase [bacterium HR20]